MAWKLIAQIALGGAVLLAQSRFRSPVPQEKALKVKLEELLSYECARSITSITATNEQTGPLFSSGHLVFTSLEARDASKILLVNAGQGNFSLPLENKGVNRIRFAMAVSENGPTQYFFLSYMHGGIQRSRFFEYSEVQPPPGHDELDYSLVVAHRADNLLPHLDYAIHETAEATLSAITEGKVARDQLARHRVENCEHIYRLSPSLGTNLRHHLNQLDLIVMGARRPAAPASAGGGRRPASIVSKK